MNGRMFTEKQRDVLRRRLERAIVWANAETFKRDSARYIATQVIDELEVSGFAAGTQRRAIEKIVASLDDAAPLRSVSPVERDAPPVADAAELDSGAAS